jgi:hypothetical protein
MRISKPPALSFRFVLLPPFLPILRIWLDVRGLFHPTAGHASKGLMVLHFKHQMETGCILPTPRESLRHSSAEWKRGNMSNHSWSIGLESSSCKKSLPSPFSDSIPRCARPHALTRVPACCPRAAFVRTHGAEAVPEASDARWRLVSRNVAADADPPKAVRPQILSWDAMEAQRFLAVPGGDRYNPFRRVALSTGMRKGELIGQRWCDVDLAKGIIQIRLQVVPVGGRIIVGEPKTKAGRRKSMLPSRVNLALSHVAAGALAKQRSLLDACGRGVEDDAHGL